jgi:hypothetical protein
MINDLVVLLNEVHFSPNGETFFFIVISPNAIGRHIGRRPGTASGECRFIIEEKLKKYQRQVSCMMNQIQISGKTNHLLLPHELIPESKDDHRNQVIPFGPIDPKSLFYDDFDVMAEDSIFADLFSLKLIQV